MMIIWNSSTLNMDHGKLKKLGNSNAISFRKTQFEYFNLTLQLGRKFDVSEDLLKRFPPSSELVYLADNIFSFLNNKFPNSVILHCSEPASYVANCKSPFMLIC